MFLYNYASIEAQFTKKGQDGKKSWETFEEGYNQTSRR